MHPTNKSQLEVHYCLKLHFVSQKLYIFVKLVIEELVLDYSVVEFKIFLHYLSLQLHFKLIQVVSSVILSHVHFPPSRFLMSKIKNIKIINYKL